MRLLIVSSAVVLVVAAVWCTSRQSVSGVAANSSSVRVVHATAEPPGDGLIVHEWGTFTSFSGSDGVRLEFRPLADEDLPPFVLDRFLQSGVTNPFSKSQIRVRVRMETPVTYFYTNRERHVNARVSFPDGLLTEFYPPVARMEPSYKLGERLPLKRSSLDWGDIHLLPTDGPQAHADSQRLLPKSDAKYHYGHARETDAALVHVRLSKPDAARPLVPSGNFYEKFLFYRGVGNFELPLKLSAASDGTFELVNSGRDPLRSLFLVEVDGQAVRFVAHDQVAVGGRLTLARSAKPTTIDDLAEAVEKALVKEGLYEKEAAAMVNTWRSSWFGETGTRLFYVVPRAITDELLPLEITPQPQQTVRVLVGRMEIMTPEQESRIESIVRKSAAAREAEFQAATAKGRQPTYAGPTELSTLGRLAEPSLARVCAISQDPAIRAEARQLLEQMAVKAGGRRN
jgi:hypothetical protein